MTFIATPTTEPPTTSENSGNSEVIDKPIKDLIINSLKELMDPKLVQNNDFIKEIANAVGKTVVKLLDEKDKAKKKEEKFYECWKEYDDHFICTPCVLLQKDAPAELKIHVGGNYGFIKKKTKKGAKRKNFHITDGKKEHCQNPLHEWCVEKYLMDKNKKHDSEEENKMAGEQVITNALWCLQRSLGAEDFVALNAKDYFCKDNFKHVANRNDSKANFFRLRNIIFDIVSEKTKAFFEENPKKSTTQAAEELQV